MRIKRTYAATMREALQIVKQEQGADAVILGNKKVPGGVELISAIDFDQQAFTSSASESEFAVPGAALQMPERLAASQPDQSPNNDQLWSDTYEAQTFGGRTEPVLGPVVKAPTKPAAKPSMQPDWFKQELSRTINSQENVSRAVVNRSVNPDQQRATLSSTAVKKQQARMPRQIQYPGRQQNQLEQKVNRR